MAGISFFPLQKSIYQLLIVDAALLALVEGIYGKPVQGAAFPYVAFGAWEAEDWSSMTTVGAAFVMKLEVWSRAGGQKQAARIMERLHALLHDAELDVEGQTLVSLRFDDSSMMMDNDGGTYRGAIRFKALVQA